MKVNSLLSEVIRGFWLLDVHQIELYAPIVEKIISGEQLEFNPNNTKALLDFVDGNGNALPEKDGEVLVPKGSFANVYMRGEVIKYGDYCTYGADEIVSALYQAQDQKNSNATIFHVDGPGGSVSAIGPFRQFAKDKTKPVIGLADQALSLHQWAAAEVCDYIIADNDVSARFGSIGIESNFVDAQPYYEKMGYKFHVIHPEESKHKNEAFQLARKGDYKMIKEEILSPMAIKFQQAIRDKRPNLKEELGVLTGKTFDADRALGIGLIDAIGSYKDALEMARRLAFKYQVSSSLK